MVVKQNGNEYYSQGDRVRLECLTGENITLIYRDDLTDRIQYGRIYEVKFTGVTDIQSLHNIAHIFQDKINEKGYEMKIRKYGDLVKGENKQSKFIHVHT